jgi:hypothetical protein
VLLRFNCNAPRSTTIDPFLRITAVDPFEIDKQTEQERDEVKDPEATITNQLFLPKITKASDFGINSITCW